MANFGGAVSNGSEELIWRALNAQLQPGETALRNVRFTDPRNGDVEADFIVFMPDAGVAVIEVKGGVVSFENGEWLTKSKDRTRRIHPIEQARKAKHALRRYLDRQPEWSHGLVRSAWFVAMPYTDVAGDMGPEGKREHLLGRSDIDSLRDKIRSQLANPLNSDVVPHDDWVEDAVSLIFRLSSASPPQPTSWNRAKPWLLLASLLVIASLTSALVTIRLGWEAALAVSFIGAALISLLWTRIGESSLLGPARKRIAVAFLSGLSLGFIAAIGFYGPEVTSGQCSPNYVPCVPITQDITCNQLKMQVRVIGEDIYSLDRDQDGYGCELYGE